MILQQVVEYDRTPRKGEQLLGLEVKILILYPRTNSVEE